MESPSKSTFPPRPLPRVFHRDGVSRILPTSRYRGFHRCQNSSDFTQLSRHASEAKMCCTKSKNDIETDRFTDEHTTRSDNKDPHLCDCTSTKELTATFPGVGTSEEQILNNHYASFPKAKCSHCNTSDVHVMNSDSNGNIKNIPASNSNPLLFTRTSSYYRQVNKRSESAHTSSVFVQLSEQMPVADVTSVASWFPSRMESHGLSPLQKGTSQQMKHMYSQGSVELVDNYLQQQHHWIGTRPAVSAIEKKFISPSPTSVSQRSNFFPRPPPKTSWEKRSVNRKFRKNDNADEMNDRGITVTHAGETDQTMNTSEQHVSYDRCVAKCLPRSSVSLMSTPVSNKISDRLLKPVLREDRGCILEYLNCPTDSGMHNTSAALTSLQPNSLSNQSLQLFQGSGPNHIPLPTMACFVSGEVFPYALPLARCSPNQVQISRNQFQNRTKRDEESDEVGCSASKTSSKIVCIHQDCDQDTNKSVNTGCRSMEFSLREKRTLNYMSPRLQCAALQNMSTSLLSHSLMACRSPPSSESLAPSDVNSHLGMAGSQRFIASITSITAAARQVALELSVVSSNSRCDVGMGESASTIPSQQSQASGDLEKLSLKNNNHNKCLSGKAFTRLSDGLTGTSTTHTTVSSGVDSHCSDKYTIRTAICNPVPGDENTKSLWGGCEGVPRTLQEKQYLEHTRMPIVAGTKQKAKDKTLNEIDLEKNVSPDPLATQVCSYALHRLSPHRSKEGPVKVVEYISNEEVLQPRSGSLATTQDSSHNPAASTDYSKELSRL